MTTRAFVTGNLAAAHGARLARSDVVAAYPITPQTQIVEHISEFVADGKMDCEFIRIESEHSAMAASIGAAYGGVRVFTATSSHGLAYMHEMLHWAAHARLPIVMGMVNRSMGPPWAIWSDHQDSISARDTGWMQLYVENNQEVLDTCIQAFKVAEHPDVQLPLFFCQDAFILSHTSAEVEMPDQKLVDKFLGKRKPLFKMDCDNPATFGNIMSPDYYMELKYGIEESMVAAKRVLAEVGKEFGVTGVVVAREIHGFLVERSGDNGIHGAGQGKIAGATHVLDRCVSRRRVDPAGRAVVGGRVPKIEQRDG